MQTKWTALVLTTFLLIGIPVRAKEPLTRVQILVQQLKERFPGEIHIVSDMDGTALDTERLLAETVIPAAIGDLEGFFSEEGKKAFKDFLKKPLSERFIHLPSTYTAEAWEDPGWGFPVSFLPDALLALYPQAASPLEAFWTRMSEIFTKEMQKQTPIPLIETFRIFFEELNQAFEGKTHWTFLTARTEDVVSWTHLQGLHWNLSKNPPRLISRGKERGRNSHENADFKIEELKKINPVEVYLDNDPTILEKLRKEREGLFFIQVIKTKSFETPYEWVEVTSECLESLLVSPSSAHND